MIFYCPFSSTFSTCGKSSRIGVNFDIQYYSGGIRSTRARIRISTLLIDRNDSGAVNFVLGNIVSSKALENIFANILKMRILISFHMCYILLYLDIKIIQYRRRFW